MTLEILREEMLFNDMELGRIMQPAQQMKKGLGADFWDSFLCRILTEGNEEKQAVWL